MKLIVTNKNEFEETQISLFSNNDELILKKTVQETIKQFLDGLPENFIADPIVSRSSAEIDHYVIRELI